MGVSTLFIIVAAVVVAAGDCRPLLGIGSHKEDLWVGVDLRLLQGGQLRSVQSQSLVGSQRPTQLSNAPSICNCVRAAGIPGALTGFSAASKQAREEHGGKRLERCAPPFPLATRLLPHLLHWKTFYVFIPLTCLHCAPWTGWRLGSVYWASRLWSHCSEWPLCLWR